MTNDLPEYPRARILFSCNAQLFLKIKMFGKSFRSPAVGKESWVAIFGF